MSNLKFRYPDQTALCFDGVDFVVQKGERVAILGSNGSGKSTLLSLLLGLHKPLDGELSVLGTNPSTDFDKISKRIGALLQNIDIQILAPTVMDDIMFSARNYGYDESELKDYVQDLLVKLDISHLTAKIPHYLSGGEKTKVALAGALVTKPDLLILDEPFEEIDPICRTEMIDLLNTINKQNETTLLFSTHNMNLVPRIADTVYLIAAGGKIMSKGSPTEIFSKLETLAACHIEPPVLGALFTELAKQGVVLDPSLTVTEAACKIKEAMLESNKK